jgi:hypothetical protein
MRKLTRKQEAFVTELVNNPKQSGVGAAMIAYGKPDKPTTYGTADTIARANLENPRIISRLHEWSELTETTLGGTVREWGASGNTRQREIAQNAAMYIHDKVHGKATQRVESTSTAVVISIDMSAASDQAAQNLT